jgi:Beta-L-arabinofuranosidase, GH127 catalytic domain
VQVKSRREKIWNEDPTALIIARMSEPARKMLKLGRLLGVAITAFNIEAGAVKQVAKPTVEPAVTMAVEPFDLSEVKLLNSPFKQAMDLNASYLLSLEPDRFLHYFRVNAGLKPKAPAYGGWEAPTSGAGRCLGHYLSALSLQYRATGDSRFKERVDYIVSELAICQQTNGFLSAHNTLGVGTKFLHRSRSAIAHFQYTLLFPLENPVDEPLRKLHPLSKTYYFSSDITSITC